MRTRGRPRHPDILTPRQWDVLALLRRGLTNEEIARELNISADGVKYHVSDILGRLGVRNRHEAAVWQPEAEGSRWTMLVAPLLLIKKLKLSAFGYGIAAAAMGGVAIGIALLMWGVWRSNGRNVVPSRQSQSPPEHRSTDIPELDSTLDLIRAQDVDALLQRVAFERMPCQPGVDIPTFVNDVVECVQQPLQGTPETSDYAGLSSVPVFSLITCEGLRTTLLSEVRRSMLQAFSLSSASSVFEVGRGSLIKFAGGYQAVVTAGASTSPTAMGSIWYLNEDAHVNGLLLECGAPTGADQLAEFHGITGDVLPPLYDCTPLPGSDVQLIVEVQGTEPHAARPQLWGPVQDATGATTGERAIVDVTPNTQWRGSVKRFEDVRQAMRLEVSGRREANCRILATSISDTPPTPTPSASAPARTKIPEIDHVIDLLLRRDVDGLVQLAEYRPIGCSVTQTVGSHPPCAPGQPEGTPINVFVIGQCEGSYATNDDQLKQAFGFAIQRQPSAAVYAILRDDSEDRTRDGYWIAITQDRPSQATADVSLWNVTTNGHVVALQNQCGPIGAAQQMAYRFPANPDFVLGPFNSCSPGPGEYANLMITVDSLSPGGIKPQFWGSADSTLGPPTGERAIVTVAPATAWYGGQKALDQVRTGMVLEAVGRRQPDCTILAETILSESTGTSVTGPPKAGTIGGQIIQDADGSKDFSLEDLPAKTLVQLVAPQRTLDLYTDADGTYRFDNIPDGHYTLRLWWTPGFADVLSAPSDPGRYDVVVTVDVAHDVPVNASGPLRVWVTPVAGATLPFPAAEAHEPVPTGSMDAGAALAP